MRRLPQQQLRTAQPDGGGSGSAAVEELRRCHRRYTVAHPVMVHPDPHRHVVVVVAPAAAAAAAAAAAVVVVVVVVRHPSRVQTHRRGGGGVGDARCGRCGQRRDDMVRRPSRARRRGTGIGCWAERWSCWCMRSRSLVGTVWW